MFEKWEEHEGSAALVTVLTRRFHETHDDLMHRVVEYAALHPEHYPWLGA